MARNISTAREDAGTQDRSIQALKQEEVEPVIGQLHDQLRSLQTERAAILKRIGTVKKIVVGLANLFGPEVISGELQNLLAIRSARRHPTHPGMTDLCRQLLRESAQPMTVRQILRQLHEQAPADMARQKNPENSLRMILRRLVAYGEVEESLTQGRFRAWKAMPDLKGRANPQS